MEAKFEPVGNPQLLSLGLHEVLHITKLSFLKYKYWSHSTLILLDISANPKES
jgi:hypothetical protein